MSVSATFDGATVEFLGIYPNGSDIYVTYRDSSDNLKVSKKCMDRNLNATTLGTNVVVS